MKKTFKTRILATLLSVAMVFTMMPQIAFAVSDDTGSDKVVQQEAAEPDEGAAKGDLKQPAKEEQQKTAEPDEGSAAEGDLKQPAKPDRCRRVPCTS